MRSRRAHFVKRHAGIDEDLRQACASITKVEKEKDVPRFSKILSEKLPVILSDL